MIKLILPLLLLTIILSCRQEGGKQVEKTKGEALIKKSIESSGGDLFENSTVSFTFRDKRYVGSRKGGDFELKRSFSDTLGNIVDTYTNNSFTREIDGKLVEVQDTMRPKYESSINSVFYFAQLPYKLDDKAVNKNYLGTEEIKDVMYEKVEVTFDEEGGGEDFDDTFVYWINPNTNFIDYLAYEYSTNGGGMRFRVNYNERIVKGMRFVDAINMKPKVKGSIDIRKVAEAYLTADLVELSRIELEEVKVEKN